MRIEKTKKLFILDPKLNELIMFKLKLNGKFNEGLNSCMLQNAEKKCNQG